MCSLRTRLTCRHLSECKVGLLLTACQINFVGLQLKSPFRIPVNISTMDIIWCSKMISILCMQKLFLCKCRFARHSIYCCVCQFSVKLKRWIFSNSRIIWGSNAILHFLFYSKIFKKEIVLGLIGTWPCQRLYIAFSVPKMKYVHGNSGHLRSKRSNLKI